MSKVKKNLRRHIKYVYIFQCSLTGVIKIGVSGDPIKRLLTINADAKDHNFKLIVTKEFPTSEACFAFEKYLHKNYVTNKVFTGRYGGYTEVFDSSILEDLLIQFKSTAYNLKRIDPYLVLVNRSDVVNKLPFYEDNLECYGRIFADLLIARLNGFDGIYCTSYTAQYSGRRTNYLRSFKLLSSNNIILVKDYEDILNTLSVEDVNISYKDRMLYFVTNAPLTYITQTVSVVEYFSSNRERFAIFRKILRSRGLTVQDIDAMMTAYKQVMKTDMNCRVEIK